MSVRFRTRGRQDGRQEEYTWQGSNLQPSVP
jgi:hypothetical protein